MSSWDHSCELHVSTLSLLHTRQEANLRTLFCTRVYSFNDTLDSNFGAINRLSVESMDLDRSCCKWEAATIIKNAATLNHLRLGFISRIAHDFALKSPPRYGRMSELFSEEIVDSLSEFHLSEVHLSLKSLHLCGLDLGSILQGEVALDIDFTKITQLRLESCPGLSQAFSIFMAGAGSSKSALRALEDLFIRLEDPDAHITNSLESFLTSIRGLIHLRVLIDNALTDQDLEPILDIHGKTLKTLVWDERSGPRTRLAASTSLFATRFGNLEVVSQKCPSLTILGIALDWEAISRPGRQVTQQSIMLNGYQASMCLGKMPRLEVLNIRNLPQIKGMPTTPMDYYVKGLAAMVVDIANEWQISTLKTIAIGAPFYRDIYIGTRHVIHNPVSDLLRLRVYSIDYNYLSPSSPSPVLSQTITGACYSSEEELYPTDLLYDYWLG